ncbi:MAG TPA: hypothetical protein VNS32_01405 [Flavisolibacter sp.]|nr:hypothetical protein [Flavisolibacter sp.]
MKIRIADNSIRLRLRQTEVKNFCAQGSITEKLELGPSASQQLSFIFKIGTDQPAILFSENKLTISIPENMARQWTQTDQVGIVHSLDNGAGSPIQLLIEKDFACLDATDEENIDTYPNPKAAC